MNTNLQIRALMISFIDSREPDALHHIPGVGDCLWNEDAETSETQRSLLLLGNAVWHEKCRARSLELQSVILGQGAIWAWGDVF